MNTTHQNRAESAFGLSVKNWWSISKRIFTNIQKHNVPLIAAGVAFYCLLAIFPLLGATISLYGLMVSPDELQKHMSLLVNVVPTDSRYIIEEQLKNLTEKSNSALGWSFLLTLVLSLWSSSKGANALITACNITYSEDNGRGFFRGMLARITCTVFMIATVIVALACISVLPEIISWAAGGLLSDKQAAWLTWPVMLVLFNISLSALYRYAPHRRSAQWRWVTPGALLATLMWIAASYGFSIYLNEFASYSKTYGSVGGIIILLMWLYLSAYIILIGAEVNASIELQTTADSTIGKDKPMGERNAVVADNTPEDLRGS
ncbi:YihY/virulence factor BrkB family protein [Alteromonas sp. 1_MG-2023]|uniref:YihY/virulence factor BrkB family protein n=1 Tax=Alteromonas sp. 1_MG-2023 TaxID=3062669 RepID=UPI0026E182E0|nr:YihY/virulence factor BrkB family protein [Alteromonas sp. 1_MG-2023]MDO6569015.1 YihY/virulence factor BrkB family protein [Alteromonas sp. 1_MG-2023]